MISIVIILTLSIALAIPLGAWIKKVMCRDVSSISRQEDWILSHLKIEDSPMSWKRYLRCVLMVSVTGFALLYILLLADGQSWDLAFNTAISFVTNTNWQAADPAFTLSWWVWAFGLVVQMFLSAAVGMSVVFALIRGFTHTQDGTVGNFWQDLTGSILYVLLPINVAAALLLSACGTPMNLNGSQASALMDPVAVSEDGNLLYDIQIENGKVYQDGKEVPEARIANEQLVPGGLMAAVEAAKQTGTNGGGLTAANSASPFENPSGWSNLIENIQILLIPMALCFSFGFMIRNKKQGMAIFLSMAVLFAIGLACCLGAEYSAANMLGKESRFGIGPSALWAVSTTAASSGSSNLSFNGMTPLGSLIPMILMQIGEVVFGGVGTGVIGMIGFVMLTVFIAGLMVGRTPEFLGKKIEPFEMKNSVILCICAPVCILAGSAIGCLFPAAGLGEGAHGFSQILYAWSSMGANNGSAMGGFATDTVLMNVLGGVLMALGRFVPLAAALAVAGSLGAKKITPVSAGTLATDTPLFSVLLVIIVLLIGALSFFPALALGPLAQFFG